MNQEFIHFSSLPELQELIGKKIQHVDNKIEIQSKIIGDKIREGENTNSEELSDLKDKLNSDKSKSKKSDNKTSKSKKTTTPKKKGKKGKSENWIDYQNLHLYNGVGTRGELELYFKSLEDIKSDSERLKRTKESVDQLLNSGIKKDLAGIGYGNTEGSFELAFIKTEGKREKFTFKSILTVGCEL